MASIVLCINLSPHHELERLDIINYPSAELAALQPNLYTPREIACLELLDFEEALKALPDIQEAIHRAIEEPLLSRASVVKEYSELRDLRPVFKKAVPPTPLPRDDWVFISPEEIEDDWVKI